MEIAHPRRILLLAPTGISSKPVLDVLVKRDPPRPSHSRTNPRVNASVLPARPASDPAQPTHLISNSYYRAEIPIWTDEVLESKAWAEQWKAEEGAGEVIRAVGAWIVCFEKDGARSDEGKSHLRNLLTGVSSVLTHHQSSSLNDSDSVLIAIAVPTSNVRSSSAAPSADSDSDIELDLDLDDLCREAGNWEYIDGTLPHPISRLRPDTDGLNEFGETVGMERLLEALAGGEWDAAADGDEDSDDDDEDLDEFFKGDVADGFGELLAAGAASRIGMLGESEHFACVKKADLAEDGDDDDDDEAEAETETTDETWQIRGAGGGLNAEGLTKANGGGGEGGDWATDSDVQGLQQMMVRLQAARDLGEDLPAAERRKVARRAVREVMKDL